jgi:hypothetical protein
LQKKAIFVIDNVPSHSNKKELKAGKITVVFLPPTITPLCPSMDQGVLYALEKKYHFKLHNSLIKTTDDGDDMLATLKKNIKVVAYWITHSCEHIETIIPKSSW